MIDLKVCELIYYAKCNLDLDKNDEIFVYNAINALLKITGSKNIDIDKKHISSLKAPDEIINAIGDYAVQNNLCDSLLKTNFECSVMGIVTNSPSKVIKKFNGLYKKDVQTACDYLYNLSIKNNYIKYTAVQKNPYWKTDLNDNFLEVTINISKPEKDNREIAKLKFMPQSGYPLCALCYENIGFCGDYNKAARQTLRVIPLVLNGEEWFMQYSPYQYYSEHCIAINKKHVPMNVNEETFKKLFDFVDLFPNYFIGSNASLPIIGGSILNHEHFQGGRHLMPLFFSENRIEYKIMDVTVSIPNWYNSVIRLVSKDKAQILKTADKVFKTWKNYSNERLDIICKTDTQHNAITPALRKDKENYILDLILRNNRTSAEHPDGIFHAHKQYQNIKKEGIGLIEAMGLFVLPGRLNEETAYIEGHLTGEIKSNESALNQNIHKNIIKTLLNKYPSPQTKAKASKIVRDYIGNICKNILECTAVFKNNAEGQNAFNNFLQTSIVL